MDGFVALLNVDKQKFAIKNRAGEYAIAALTSGSMPEVGDMVSGAFQRLGEASLVNLTKRNLMRVDVTHAKDLVAYRARQLL